MSFRARLTSFFVVIVVVPMIAIGFLVFRLIDQSQQGKADARADGVATSAASIYESESATARLDAATIARSAGAVHGAALRARVGALATQAGVARVRVTIGPRVLLDLGGHTAIAPGVAKIESPGGRSPILIAVSELTAQQYARELVGPNVAIVVRQGSRTLASTLAKTTPRSLPGRGSVSVGGTDYQAVTQRFHGFGRSGVDVTVFSSLLATASSLTTSRLLAAVFIAGFLLLAFSFSLLASRTLQGQVNRFLQAARGLAAGDFSSRVPVEGRDEFAELGREFNEMSDQLARRIEELARERAKLRQAIHRIGETFAANLDRPALLELALRTAVDAVQASVGRLSARSSPEDPLVEVERIGSLAEFEESVLAAEKEALANRGIGESGSEKANVASITLGTFEPEGRARALITVGRNGAPLTDDDREVLRSLASEATLALENVELHFQVQRQAVTDELTRLANHRRFQELLDREMEEVRRYRYPVGLIMLDIDDFKSVNDSYGHPQGDVVLKQVARVLSESSREVDVAARYGGEELALILPHTDLDGAHAIAERVRDSIEALRIPRLDGQGDLHITASVGVSATSGGNKDALIAEADAALYTAKRRGKNRAVKAQPLAAEVLGAE
jgi:diguanylate cyclase (GGDEF)-like protein